jgi:hypothetical protein
MFTVIALAAVSLGTLQTPNGNPTGGPVASSTGEGKSTLDPTPGSYRISGDCPWVVPALAAQGFSAANNWTIDTAALSGSLTLNIYDPWVNTAAAFNCDTLGTNDRKNPQSGGSRICITYQPAGSDPSGNQVRWLQVIRTNSASNFGQAHGVSVGGGYYHYLDNGYGFGTRKNAAGKDPYYGGDDIISNTGYAAHDKGFLDVPARSYLASADWEAQVFIAKGDLELKKITIYDGVWWGFQTQQLVGCLRDGDINADGIVGIGDFLSLLQDWGVNPGDPADLDEDGIVGITDFLTLLGNWGPCGDDSLNDAEHAAEFDDYSCGGNRPFVVGTVGATTDGPLVPGCGFDDDEIHNDVWFCFTAPDTGGVVVNLTDSSFDSRLAVYDGCGNPAGLDLIACNGRTDDNSRVAFSAVAGNSYLIRAGSTEEGIVGFGEMWICPAPDFQCGDAGAGSCCTPHPDAACGDAGCCTTICAGDPYCCDFEWDQVCVDLAVAGCGGACAPAP